MKNLILFLAAMSALAQNYGSYNNQPVARMSFLRSQWTASNVLRDSSLIAYWPLAKKADAAYDYSGHRLNGSFNGSSPFQSLSSKIGPYAPYFNKSAQNFVGIPSITIPSPFTFTISAWAWPNALQGGYDRIMETNFASGFFLGTDSSMAKWQLIVDNPSIGTCAVGGTLKTQQWQMVTGAYDGTNGYLYVNGVLAAGPCPFTPPTTGLTNVSLRIGCFNSGSACSSPSSAWDGEISGVRIYNRVLSVAEIQTIYNAENH